MVIDDVLADNLLDAQAPGEGLAGGDRVGVAGLESKVNKRERERRGEGMEQRQYHSERMK